MEIDEMDFNRVKELLESIKNENYTDVILTGGEITLRKDILNIIELAKNIGLSKLHIQTNGRRFSDLEFAEKIVRGNENFIDIFLSIHGHTADIHEGVTNTKGSFDETSKGIDNLVSLGAPIRTNTVISKYNYLFLDEIADFLLVKQVINLQFSFIHPIGEALKNPEAIPNIEDTIPFLKKALTRNTGNTKILVEAIPFCLLEEDYIYATENFLNKKEDLSKNKGEDCDKCVHYATCPGIWKRYFSLKGFDFKPIIKETL